MKRMKGGETLSAIAPAEAAGERIDVWLTKAWPELSRARVQGLIGAGKLSADGAPVTHAKDKVRPGARYELVLPPPEPAAPLPESIPLDIAFRGRASDRRQQAAGMAVHPAPGSMRGTLVNALLAHCGDTLSALAGVARPGIVHRIDKDTTGLIVVAKNDARIRPWPSCSPSTILNGSITPSRAARPRIAAADREPLGAIRRRPA